MHLAACANAITFKLFLLPVYSVAHSGLPLGLFSVPAAKGRESTKWPTTLCQLNVKRSLSQAESTNATLPACGPTLSTHLLHNWSERSKQKLNKKRWNAFCHKHMKASVKIRRLKSPTETNKCQKCKDRKVVNIQINCSAECSRNSFS